LAVIGSLAVVATREYFGMLLADGVKCYPRYGLLLAVVYCGLLYAGLLGGGNRPVPPSLLDGLTLFAAVAGPFIALLREPVKPRESLGAVAFNVCGFVYVAWLFNFCARLLFCGTGSGQMPGAWLLLWLVAVTKFTDMGAYIAGVLLGRHKMIPHISPAKTWEGFVGSLLFAELAGCGLVALWPGHYALLGGLGPVSIIAPMIALLAVAGDLAESVVKRAIHAKDSGRMLPGIGGSLDLIDSICFTAPALYFYLKWVLLPAA
jgi:phosphatidate cytidylyltransferase